tara:strand:+ start:2366 stop:3640 length:1275 start_codon:yes stop_codon:yes gene_type:complete
MLSRNLAPKLISSLLVFSIIWNTQAYSQTTPNIKTAHKPDTTTCFKSNNDKFLQQLSSLDIKITAKEVSDYVKINKHSACFLEASPKDTESVSKLVNFAYQHNIPIRTQGNSHSGNGSSLPSDNELLIHTDLLNQISFGASPEITVGTGIPIATIKDYVEDTSDYTLPVINGGGAAPTLGGFISAGGISFSLNSEASKIYGGLWNHITQMTIVIGDGKVMTLKQDNELFPWVFGAMGQLGIITQAKLTLIPKNPANTALPIIHQANITYEHQDFLDENHRALHWFNLFVTHAQAKQALQDINKLQADHSTLLDYAPAYHWLIHANRFTPPLIFPSKNFEAVVIWGRQNENFSKKELLQMEKEFAALVKSKNYRRYIQVEAVASPQYYKAYFGEPLYQEYFSIKKKLDPKLLFNSNTVFKSQPSS